MDSKIDHTNNTMPGRFPFTKLAKYPHMKPADIEIWERFIDSTKTEFEVEYDVSVGSAPDFIDEATPKAEQGTQKLYARKIDVVLHGAETIYIVEVKPRAGASALGQATGYSTLYRRDYKPTLTVIPVVLTDELQTDVKEMADAQGVLLWVA